MLHPEAHRSRHPDTKWPADWAASTHHGSVVRRTTSTTSQPPAPSHHSDHGYAQAPYTNPGRQYPGPDSSYAGSREHPVWAETWTSRPAPYHHTGATAHPPQAWDPPPRHPAHYGPAPYHSSGHHSPGHGAAVQVKYELHEGPPASWGHPQAGNGRPGPPYGDYRQADRGPPQHSNQMEVWWPPQARGEVGGTRQAEKVQPVGTFLSRYTVGGRPSPQVHRPEAPPVYVPHPHDEHHTGPRGQPPAGYHDTHGGRGRKYSHTINDICEPAPSTHQPPSDKPPLARCRDGESPPHLPLPGVAPGGEERLGRVATKRAKLETVAVSGEEKRAIASRDSDSTSTEYHVQRQAHKQPAKSQAALLAAQLSREERGRQVVDRRRRHNTKQCLDELQTLLPAVADGPRANSTTVLQAAVDYIGTLGTLTGTGPASQTDEWGSIVLDRAGALWLLVDDDAIVLRASTDCMALLGGEDQVVGRSVVELVGEEEQGSVAAAVQKGDRATVCLADTATDRGPFVLSARPVTDAETDNLYHVVTLARPELKLYLDAYFEWPTHTDEMISHHLPSGITTYATSNIRSLFGYLPEDFIGMSPYNFYHMDDMQRIILSHQDVVADHPNSVIYRFLTRTSGHVWVKTTAQLILGPDGQPADIMCRTSLSPCLEASVLTDDADDQPHTATVTPRDFGLQDLTRFVRSIERENNMLRDVLQTLGSGPAPGAEATDAPAKKGVTND